MLHKRRLRRLRKKKKQVLYPQKVIVITDSVDNDCQDSFWLQDLLAKNIPLAKTLLK